MTARLRPPHARTASPPRPVLRRSPWRSSCGEQPRLEPERRQGLALGDRGERPVSGRRRGRTEDAEVDARGDVGIARVPEDVLDHAVVSVPVDGAARPVFGPVVDGQQRPRVGALEGLEDEGHGPGRDQGLLAGGGVDRGWRAARARLGLGASIGVKTSTRVSPATATRTSRGRPRCHGRDGTPGCPGAHGPPRCPRRRGHAIEHGHAVDACSGSARAPALRSTAIARTGRSSRSSSSWRSNVPSPAPASIRWHGSGRPSRSQIWRTASATKAPNTGCDMGTGDEVAA